MTTPELKNSIHQKIDEIEDQIILEEVKSIVDFITSPKGDWNDLPENVKQAIEDGINQLDNGRKISYEEVKQRHARWFTM
jgi:hypothetical protein